VRGGNFIRAGHMPVLPDALHPPARSYSQTVRLGTRLGAGTSATIAGVIDCGLNTVIGWFERAVAGRNQN
jgi:hypothetical protein